MSIIKWHPFPKEKPKKKGRYLVTAFDSEDKTVKPYVIVDRWRKKWGHFWATPDWDVLAWAKMPKPYRKPDQEDMHPDAITARKYNEGDPETIKRLGIFDEE